MVPILELRIAAQSLSGDGPVKFKTIPLGSSKTGYREVGFRLAYSPERLLLAPINEDGRLSPLCDSVDCASVELPLYSFVPLFNFVIVDDGHRVIFLLTLKNLTVPQVRIRKFDY